MIDRKEFLRSATTLGLGCGLCSAIPATLAEASEAGSGAPTHPCDERVKFAEEWVGRFMGVLDEGLDEATRARIMEANGAACARAYLASSGRETSRVPYEQWVDRVRSRGPRQDLRIEGNVIHFQYLSNYQGKDAPEGACLCPLVETKPKGLSGTFCHCSVGYVREIFSRQIDRPLKVELVEAVLRGGKRCRFKIEVV